MLVRCLLKYLVCDRMLLFVLMGACEGSVRHFTLRTLQPQQCSWFQDALCVWGGAILLLPKKAWLPQDGPASGPKAELRGLPKCLAPNHTRTKEMGSSAEPGGQNQLFLLVLWFLGCYHNSTDSSRTPQNIWEGYT